MSNRVKVDKDITFSDNGHGPNVIGPMQEGWVHWHDHFLHKAIDTTNRYTVTVGGTNDAIAIVGSSASGGWISILPGDTDNEACFIATGLDYVCTQGALIAECKVKLADVSQTAFFFGFSDATSETTPAMPIDADSATITAAADDVAGFVIDADLSTSSVYVASEIALSGSPQSADMGFDAEDDTWYVLRVELDTSGNATFYARKASQGTDEAVTARIASAITTTDYLCVILGAATRDNGGGDYVYVDRLDVWQQEVV